VLRLDQLPLICVSRDIAARSADARRAIQVRVGGDGGETVRRLASGRDCCGQRRDDGDPNDVSVVEEVAACRAITCHARRIAIEHEWHGKSTSTPSFGLLPLGRAALQITPNLCRLLHEGHACCVLAAVVLTPPRTGDQAFLAELAFIRLGSECGLWHGRLVEDPIGHRDIEEWGQVSICSRIDLHEAALRDQALVLLWSH